MDTLTSLQVFCTVAELKSFAAAATRLGLSPAMASKHIGHLETRLRTRLLNRTSRRVSLTEAGTLYFNQTRPMLDGLDEVEAAISNVTVIPRGTLRFSAPVWAASAFFTRMLAEYHQRYPDVAFDIDLSGRRVSLVEEGFDLALRATTPGRLDPGLIARPLMPVSFMLVGTPTYLARTGRPRTVSELNGHALLMYSGMSADGNLTLNTHAGEQTVRFRPIMRSENEVMLRWSALEGMGLVFLPVWMIQTDLSTGALEKVLPEEATFNTTLHAVYPSRKYLSAKVHTFIEFLSAQKSPSA